MSEPVFSIMSNILRSLAVGSSNLTTFGTTGFYISHFYTSFQPYGICRAEQLTCSTCCTFFWAEELDYSVFYHHDYLFSFGSVTTCYFRTDGDVYRACDNTYSTSQAVILFYFQFHNLSPKILGFKRFHLVFP